jgi:alpha-ribazole phosphatase
VRRVYLLRHGATEANENRLYCGASDLPLSEGGRTELARLKAEWKYPACKRLRLYTSGMLRTEQTLQVLFGEVPHTAIAEMREINFGAFELRAYEELKELPDYLDWISGENEKNRCPGGESGAGMEARVLAAFDRLLQTEGDFLIVSHGGPIAAIMSRLFPEEGKNRYDWQPPAGRGYAICLEGIQALSYRAIPEPELHTVEEFSSR